MSEVCSVYRSPSLACTACLRQVLKNGLWENIVFAHEPRGKAQRRQRRKRLIYLPLPHTHSEEEACCQSPYLSLLLYSVFPLMMFQKAKATPVKCVFVFLCL